jgi:hypothetical protein
VETSIETLNKVCNTLNLRYEDEQGGNPRNSTSFTISPVAIQQM